MSGAQWSAQRLRHMADLASKRGWMECEDALRDFARVVSYPHQDGDFTVLGPEVFASPDESVICWRGENYYRADALDAGRGDGKG